MLKIALVGLGHAARHQMDAIQSVDSIELVGAHDIETERAALLPNHIMFYETFDSLLGQSRADLFLVSTSTPTHFEIGMSVLKNNRSLLLEKPCVVNFKDLEVLKYEVESSGIFCAAALHAAYGQDVLWYKQQAESGTLDYGPLSGFFSGFYDPYYKDGAIISSARGLMGSWLDSGINALSVIAELIDIQNLEVEEGRMTVIDKLQCTEIQGLATLQFKISGRCGKGIIDTNWALGIDRKRTHLFYTAGNTEVILDHSNENVVILRDGREVERENLQTGLPRLTNHYTNLFRDLVQMYRKGEDNFEKACELHRLMLTGHNQ